MSGSASRSDPKIDPLLPDNWHALAPLVDAILDAPLEHRDALLTKLSAGDAVRRAELERVVAECERDLPLLNRPASERFEELLGGPSEAPLPEILGGRYRIERELGRGGMARVFLARDTKHARDVAVKVIRPELAASLGRERFLREIEIAARLRHPNIVPLYDSGDADGVLYFVMPYEEGPSLRTRLTEGAVSAVECVSTLRDVARALAYAHEHGVVHRDVKPDNVMLSGGAAVVTDFGIAKAVSVAQTGAGGATLTQLGAGIGTPAYMAPEQAIGDPSTDHRADIYSFGCLAYELFAGRPPFHDLPTHLIIAAHVGTKPIPVTDVCAEVPASVAQLIARCLEKNPADRPQSARELLTSLDEPATNGAAAPPPMAARAARRSRTWWWAGFSLAAALIAATVYLASRRSGPSITIAVVPFGNTAADTSMDFVAVTLADEVASALQRVPGIQIVSRSGARAYLGRLAVDVTEAGEKLKSDYVMQGVIRQDRGVWILSAYLERTKDAASLWDGQFTVGRDGEVGAAEEIAASVVAELRARLPRSIGQIPVLTANLQTKNPEAYRLYLRGNYELARRRLGIKEIAELFRAAIHNDARFAPAYSGLSMTTALFPYFLRLPVTEVHDSVVTAANRALALNAGQAQPHTALGMSYQFDYEWQKAEREFKTAIQLDRRDVEARVQYARHLRFRGRRTESLNELRVANAQDPNSALVVGQLAYAYYLNKQRDSALLQNKRALEIDSVSPPSMGNGALLLLGSGFPAEARQLAGRVPTTSSFAGAMNYVIAKSGDSLTALQRLREMESRTPPPPDAESFRALTYLGLADTARALIALENATKRNEIWHVAHGLYDPMFDSIRETERFKALRRAVKLDP